MLRRAQNNFFVPTGAKSYAQPRCLFVRSISVWHILFRPRGPTIRCCCPRRELRWQDGRTNCRAQLRANVLRRQGCGRHRRAGVPPGPCPIPDSRYHTANPQAVSNERTHIRMAPNTNSAAPAAMGARDPFLSRSRPATGENSIVATQPGTITKPETFAPIPRATWMKLGINHAYPRHTNDALEIAATEAINRVEENTSGDTRGYLARLMCLTNRTRKMRPAIRRVATRTVSPPLESRFTPTTIRRKPNATRRNPRRVKWAYSQFRCLS